MVTSNNVPRETQGRARGLLLVWRRELECKLRINNYLPGCSGGDIANYGREETWGLTIDYGLTWNGRQFHGVHPDPKETNGPHAEELPQRLPGAWPNCLGRGFHINPPTPPRIEVQAPSPTSSTISSDSSGCPSLESLMEP